jgi:hypothetical protein
MKTTFTKKEDHKESHPNSTLQNFLNLNLQTFYFALDWFISYYFIYLTPSTNRTDLWYVTSFSHIHSLGMKFLIWNLEKLTDKIDRINRNFYHVNKYIINELHVAHLEEPRILPYRNPFQKIKSQILEIMFHDKMLDVLHHIYY